MLKTEEHLLSTIKYWLEETSTFGAVEVKNRTKYIMDAVNRHMTAKEKQAYDRAIQDVARAIQFTPETIKKWVKGSQNRK